MRTLLEVLNLCAAFLQQNGVEPARRQAEELLSAALEMQRMELYLQYDRPLAGQELDRVRAWLKRRAKGEPLAYIMGEVQFFGCQIKVAPDVLIPRQETEILVDLISKELARSSLEGKSLWDLCCGSGCIGIALKRAHPSLHVVLADQSAAALEVARQNALRNSVEVELLQGDLLAPFGGRTTDFLVCNPPYVTETEFKQLEREVAQFEPRAALVGGPTGLEFYKRLAAELPRCLVPGAKAWFEIGAEQGSGVQQLFQAAHWKNCCVQRDWAGKDRFFSLEIE